MAEKRVIEYEAASAVENDDWLLIDGVTEGTRKARPSTVTAELGQQVTNIATIVGGLTQVAMGHGQSFAPSYDESTSYDVGDLVMQYNCLYKCTAPTTGTWDSSKWQLATVAEQLEESGKIDDVQVNGISVVTDKVASIDLTGMQADIDSKQADTKIGGASILDNNKVANLDFLASYGTASGSIASFNDGAAMPLKSLKVGIEPVQDLHGYDNPWPAGGGKNKCNAQNPIVLSQAGNIGEQPCVISAGTYTFSWTSSASTAITLTLWNGSTQIGTFSSTSSIQGRGNLTFTITENVTYLKCYFNGATTVSDIQVEAGSQATTYAPYSNICPIEGWTEANVTRTGKNIWGGLPLAQDIEQLAYQPTLDTTNKTLLFTNAKPIEGAFSHPIPNGISYKENTQYTCIFAYKNNGQNNCLRISYTDGNSEAIELDNSSNTKILKVFTTQSNKTVKDIIFSYYTNAQTYLYYEESGLFEGVITADDFEPYAGTTIPITFVVNGETKTIYSGYVEIKNGKVKAVATYTKTALVDIPKTKYGNYPYGIRVISSFFDSIPNDVMLTGMSNTFVLSGSGESYSVDRCSIVFSSGTSKTSLLISTQASGLSADASVTEINEWLRSIDAYIVYPLATPIEYDLADVSISTQDGTNNLWADTGEILECKYVRDNSAVINDLIARVTALENE